MKQQIMEKLFAEKPLTNAEILYIGANLDEPTKEGSETKENTRPRFDHSQKELARACGLTDADFEHINNLIRSEVMDRKDDLNCNSKQIEVYERIGLAKPSNLRLLMYQFVKMKSALQSREGGSIRINGKGDLGDFLDFLRGRGM